MFGGVVSVWNHTDVLWLVVGVEFEIVVYDHLLRAPLFSATELVASMVDVLLKKNLPHSDRCQPRPTIRNLKKIRASEQIFVYLSPALFHPLPFSLLSVSSAYTPPKSKP